MTGIVNRITAALALLGSAAAVLYVLGGVALAWQLDNQGLPASAVVWQLPREFLLSVTVKVLGWTLLCAISFSVLGLITWAILHITFRTTRLGGVVISGFVITLGLAVFLVALGILLINLLLNEITEFNFGLSLNQSVRAAVWAITCSIFLIVFVTIVLTSSGSLKSESRGLEWSGIFHDRTIAILAVVGLLLSLVFGMTSQSRIPLSNVVACQQDGGVALAGSFIGQTNDRTYVGEQLVFRWTEARIASIPNDQLGLVLIGGEIDTEACKSVEPPAESNDSSTTGENQP